MAIYGKITNIPQTAKHIDYININYVYINMMVEIIGNEIAFGKVTFTALSLKGRNGAKYERINEKSCNT